MCNKLIICLGSNMDCEANMVRANEMLCGYFDRICLSDMVYTEPMNLPGSGFFLNQVGIAHSNASLEEVNQALKDMECKLGRTPTSKQAGLIPIDIDLLQWNELILKPADLEREYVRLLLFRLSSAMHENEWS